MFAFRLWISLLCLLVTYTLSSRLKYRFSVKENVDLFYTIASLDQMLSVNYHQSIEFLNINSPYTTYFLVDGQKLRTSRLIDREEFCRIKLCENSRCQPCEMEMDFVLKENGQSKDIISIVLTIEDVNEYRPEFFDRSNVEDQTIRLNISEGVPVGHILPIPSATDKDGEDDALIYWLDKSMKTPFELVFFGDNQIALNVTEPLDRESEDFYELHLTASDRGNLTSTIIIHLSISDINDNVPVFDQQTPYAINLSENAFASLTYPILRIRAADADANENGRVTYHFSGQVSESIRQTFQLNSQTGELFLLRPLDYEQTKEYRIQIRAQDSGPVSVPVYTVIIITVEDENDNKPVITLRLSEYFPYVNNTLFVSEETALNTLLMHVLVQDFDSGVNAQVHCSIESAEHLQFNVTKTVSHMFGVYTAERFDRERQASYFLRVIVEDEGLRIRHRTTRDLQLVITDTNDCAPRFAQPSYDISVQEEEEFPGPVFRFEAIDDDAGENGQITYELISNDYHYLFYLHEKTGDLYLRQRLNREKQSIYNFTIRARDHGKYPQSLFTDVPCLIRVLDTNEFRPMFDREAYRFNHIPEEVPRGTSVGVIRAIDDDDHPLRYSISSADFIIDEESGEIFVGRALDYDQNPSCRKFFGMATDPAGWNASCAIEVCLEPVNEYAPEIRPESRLINVNINNQSVVNLQAHDRDSSPNSFLTLRLMKPTPCNLTLLPNGTIHLQTSHPCLGIFDLSLAISDNDQYPVSKISSETVRLVIYSDAVPLQKVLMKNKLNNWTIEIVICSVILALLLVVMCLALYLVYRHRMKLPITKVNSSSKINRDQLSFPEKHCLLNEGIIDMTKMKLHTSPRALLASDTSSSYNDSCYGSSDMDVYPHHHLHQSHQQQQATNHFNGKVLLGSNENYIILCKDHASTTDETTTTGTSASSSSSSSPSSVTTTALITRCQTNKRNGIASQPYVTQTEFFQNDHEYRRVLGSTTSFQCRNMTPVNEYYL